MKKEPRIADPRERGGALLPSREWRKVVRSVPLQKRAPDAVVFWDLSFSTECAGSLRTSGDPAAVLDVSSYDPGGTFLGHQLSLLHIRDIHTEWDKNGNYPPALYEMQIARMWWTTSGSLMIGLQRVSIGAASAKMDHAAIVTWEPGTGMGTVYFHSQPQQFGIPQVPVGGTMFVPADDQAYLVFMDHMDNAGLAPGTEPKRWASKELDKEGLVPMVVHFDGELFGPRQPAMDEVIPRPYRTDIWLSNAEERESVLILATREEMRMLRVRAR